MLLVIERAYTKPSELKLEDYIDRLLLDGCTKWHLHVVAVIENFKFLKFDLNKYQTHP